MACAGSYFSAGASEFAVELGSERELRGEAPFSGRRNNS